MSKTHWRKLGFGRNLTLGLLLAIGGTLPSCAPNPASGKMEAAFISESREIRLGQDNYKPLRQSQGGDYVADPEVGRYVSQLGHKLAAVSERPHLPYEFAVVNDSTVNAWALPGGKIAVHRGLLLELDSEAALAAVVSHEIGHAVARHTARRMEKQMLFGTILSVLSAVGVGDAAVNLGGAGLQMVSLKFSRSDELEADRLGMRYMSRAGYDPRGAVDLQQMFLDLEKQKKGGKAGWLSTHPPSKQRLDENHAYSKKLPPGGVYGKADYRSTMARLLRNRKAYELLDEGENALKKKDYAEALRLGEEAQNIEPLEARIYSLIGQAEYRRNHLQESHAAFTRAMELDSTYFYYPFGRGVVNYDLRNKEEARSDLQRSLAIIKTKDAQNMLSKVERLK
jgi:predicted Zn-dependent protease